MPRGIIVAAALILALMVAAKDGRLPRKAGLTASCVVARQESDGGQLVACRAGVARGPPRSDAPQLPRRRRDGDVHLLALPDGAGGRPLVPLFGGWATSSCVPIRGRQRGRRAWREVGAALRPRCALRSNSADLLCISSIGARYSRAMRVEERASAERVLAARERFVPRGVSTTDLVVARAWGARLWDADGREYIDFAGGIACQNLGHGAAGVTRAIHEQVDRYLHQCFMVGIYEPYVALAERLDERLARRARDEVDPPELGRGSGRERGQDRARRDRPRRASSSSTAPSTAART